MKLESDVPEATPEMFARAVVRRGLKPATSKQQVTISLDDDVLEWFRAQGEGYQTRINSCCVRTWKHTSHNWHPFLGDRSLSPRPSVGVWQGGCGGAGFVSFVPFRSFRGPNHLPAASTPRLAVGGNRHRRR